MTVNQTSVSLDDAQRVIAAGQAKATEIESPSNIAVVDAGGNLVAHVRMDGAWIASIDISEALKVPGVVARARWARSASLGCTSP